VEYPSPSDPSVKEIGPFTGRLLSCSTRSGVLNLRFVLYGIRPMPINNQMDRRPGVRMPYDLREMWWWLWRFPNSRLNCLSVGLRHGQRREEHTHILQDVICYGLGIG
jgi:hypothetical protein